MGRESGKEKARKVEKDVKEKFPQSFVSQHKAPCHLVNFELRKNILSFFSLSFFPIFLFSPKGKFPNPPRFRG